MFHPATLLVVVALSACRKNPPESVPDMPEARAYTAPPAAPAPTPPAAEPTAPRQYQDVYFDFDRSNIRADQVTNLESDLALLLRDTQTIVEIQGHCDERGTTDYNLALGQRRADAAKRWLVARGVAASRIHTISYGEERPVDPGHDEDAWARNRRDEFHPVGAESPAVAEAIP
jgi:peptidoglycan-associated lipoprotein